MYFHVGDDQFIGVDRVDDDTVWLEIAIGSGLGWAREFIKSVKKLGYKKVQFATQEDNKAVHAIARYFGAKKMEAKKEYSDGSKGVFYEVSLTGRRF